MKQETYQTYNQIRVELENTFDRLIKLGEELHLEKHKKEANYLIQFAANLADKLYRVNDRINKLDTKEMKKEELTA